jgi:hypothetical protein
MDLHEREQVLVLGPAERTRQIAGRLVALDCRGARASDLVTALQAQRTAPKPIHLGIVATDHGLDDLSLVLQALAAYAPLGGLRWIACGPPPHPSDRATLRHAGVRYALFEPFTDEELRFVLNQARHEGQTEATRTDQRVPADLRARIVARTGEKVALLYNLSPTGAYLVTPRPTLRGGEVRLHFELPPDWEVSIDGHVVWNNVPGNLRRGNAPIGMGVRFVDIPAEVRTRLLDYVAERAKAYRL